MMELRLIRLLLISTTTLLLCSNLVVYAQDNRHIDNGFRIGASINYGGIYFESKGNSLNDIWSDAFGYQAHLLYGYNISSLFSLQSGVELFFHRYKFDEQQIPETNATGEPTGNTVRAKMDGTVGTTYLNLPLNLVLHPIASRSFYVIIGPEISYKIGYSNATLVGTLETESGEIIQTLFENLYDIPERSRNTLISANAGIGYNLGSNLPPLNIELRAKHTITPYLDGDNFIPSWIRNLSLTISYRL